MAHHSKFPSVNLNKSYGKPSPSSSPGYGNGRPRSAGGGGGTVVLSRPRSSSGSGPHKIAPRLAVPPPVNLPSLRKEHERLDPASSKPSAGHGGSGLGPGHSSSMSWTKPVQPVPDSRDKDGGGKSLSSGDQHRFNGASRPQGFVEKAVILRGEDFPSLMATSIPFSKQKQKQIGENSDGWEEKAEVSSMLDMRPQLRSSPLARSNVMVSEGRSSRLLGSPEQSRREGANFPGPLPLVRLRHTSDWDDDERDRNHGSSGSDHHDGRSLLDGGTRTTLSRDSGRGAPFGREFMAYKKEDRDVSSWRAAAQPNRDLSTSRALHVDGDHVGPRNSSVSRVAGKESSHDRLLYGEAREFGFGKGTGSSEVPEVSNHRAEVSNHRAEVSNSWQRGKQFSNGKISKGPISPGIRGFSSSDPVLNFSKEKLVSNVEKPYVEDISWSVKGTLSSDSMLDLTAKVFRKKKETMKHTDFFDPVRESFEAELEKVQQLQEQERQRVMEEQARAMEIARREAEERERIAREEEERRRLLEEEAREAAWRAEQEKLEAARRAEEQRIAREEEKRKILMEEERRKEAARQKLLELEARIARRQTEANAKDDRMKERSPLMDSDRAAWEKTDRMVEVINSPSPPDSSSMNRLHESSFRPHNSSFENYSFAQQGKPENNWSHNNNSSFKLQDQDSGYPSSQQDAFTSKRGFQHKQYQGTPKPVTLSFKGGMTDDQIHTGQSWDRNRDYDQFNGRSSFDTMFGGWDSGQFDGIQLAPYSERSVQNNELDDLAPFSRVRHTLRQPRVPPPPSLSFSMREHSFGALSERPESSLSVDSDARSNPKGRKEESDMQIVYSGGYQQSILEPGSTELLEENASSLLQTEKGSPKYGSQSSLCVSSPPSSPTQPSHDEFDECGGSPTLTTSAEEENMTSDSKQMMPEFDAGHVDTEVITFSHGEDDEWAVEVNEEIQEEEDQDDGLDINHEDDKVHEDDAWGLQMKNKLEDLDAVVEKPKNDMRNAASGMDGCIQLGSSDNYVLNKDSWYNEKTSTNLGAPRDSTTHLDFADDVADSLQSKDTIINKVIHASIEIAEQTDNAQEGTIFGPVSTANPPHSTRESINSAHNPMAHASCLPSSSASSMCSISASVPKTFSQDEVPVKLQFGLFSSPPLIPSPLPTIQIGSIQMPLPLHGQIDSYAQMRPSPPLFQFGHIRYTPSILENVLPIAAQNISYGQRPASPHHSLNQNPGSSLNSRVNQSSILTKSLENSLPSFSADKKTSSSLETVNPERLGSGQPTELLDALRDKVLRSDSQVTFAASDEKKALPNFVSHSDNFDATSTKNFRSLVNSKRGRGRTHVESIHSIRKSMAGLRAPGNMSGNRGGRFLYNVRHDGSHSYPLRTDNSQNSNQPQRRPRRHIQGTEYRVKENDGGRQMQGAGNFHHGNQNWKPNTDHSPVGIPLKNLGRKGYVISKSTKLIKEEEAPHGAQVVGADIYVGRDDNKESVPKSSMVSGNFSGGERNLKKSGLMEDDADPPLRSGIVRIFNQPGIEASTDGDGFVEVRSKRKISNERRGHKERETNPKNKMVKAPRRHRATLSSNAIASKSYVVTNSTVGVTAKGFYPGPAITKRSSPDMEVSLFPSTIIAGQTIPPIGNPAVDFSEYDAKFSSLKPSPACSDTTMASAGAKVTPSLSFGNNILALDKASVPLGTWETVDLNLQANSATESQLDETSNPVQSNPVSVVEVSLDDGKHATSSISNERQSFPSANLLNFPFAGEKIQFGAVASPLTLPPSSQSVPSGIWPPGSVILNAPIIHNLPVNDKSQSGFFDKEKSPSDSCMHLDDTEAEAEAAASAVAVAAISNDEITVSRLGTGSISENKSLYGPGVTGCTGMTGHPASEESLVVTLPADLSLDNPQPLWPPLPSLQSSRPVLSHITGPQPAPFPFFDPNPMLGGPIFAFRPQDEATGSQGQQQQNTNFGSGPTETWPQCHSGVDSFYGSPAGFPAPFMSPPGGLPGVPGHPQMVFYNHFAPVGQFGQVGLSYMSTTYIPSGKQPDWKHSSEPTPMSASKADPINLNVIYGQQKATQVPPPIQHLSTGSGVMPVTSPFTMFNLRPFQPSTEISVPAHWSPIPHPSPHSIRLSTAPEELQSLPSDVPGTNLSLREPHSAVADWPDELSLVESTASNSGNSRSPAKNNNKKDPKGIPISAASIVILGEGSGTGMGSSISIQNTTAPKPHTSQRTTSPVQQHLGPIGMSDLLRGNSPKMSSGSEWRRRNTFQTKHRNTATDKNIGPSKVKQIYVVKSLPSDPATSS